MTTPSKPHRRLPVDAVILFALLVDVDRLREALADGVVAMAGTGDECRGRGGP